MRPRQIRYGALDITTYRGVSGSAYVIWGNYLIIEVAGIPLHIGEHPEHFGCNMCQLIYIINRVSGITA